MLTSNGTHRSNDGDEVDSPVPDLLGVIGPLGVEIETHIELFLWMNWIPGRCGGGSENLNEKLCSIRREANVYRHSLCDNPRVNS